MRMEALLHTINQQCDKGISFESLGGILKQTDFQSMDLSGYIPEKVEGNYSRNVIQMNPLEVVVLRWPEGASSAIHHHEGFWGYVVVVEGACDNVVYKENEDVLIESITARGLPGAVLPETDGVIHALKNPSETEEAITIHFYYPPLTTFDGMRIFDIDHMRIGVLNERAQTSSWAEPETSFHSIERGVFSCRKRKGSHVIFPVLPKPGNEEIDAMNMKYYGEQAHVYDYFDTRHETRNKYTSKINDLISSDLETIPELNNMLFLACGTGRRGIEIKQQVSHDFDLIGVDISAEMCQQAAERGYEVICSSWLDADLGTTKFDSASFLYAFGHLGDKTERISVLKKVYEHLRPGAHFYVDVFNAKDEHEWGPFAVKTFEEHNLADFGYERGDVFYKKNEGKEIAFLHYFTQEEIADLLHEVGFTNIRVHHIGYVRNSGELLEDHNGALFIIAEK